MNTIGWTPFTEQCELIKCLSVKAPAKFQQSSSKSSHKISSELTNKFTSKLAGIAFQAALQKVSFDWKFS